MEQEFMERFSAFNKLDAPSLTGLYAINSCKAKAPLG